MRPRSSSKTPGWILAFQFFAIIALIPLLQAFLLTTLFNPLRYMVALPVGVAAWMRLHSLRREGWLELRFKFDETLEPAVQSLDLLR